MGRGRTDARDQSRFSYVRQPHQTHIGDEFENQRKLNLLSRVSHLVIARSLVSRGGELGVPSAAAPSNGSLDPLSGNGEIVEQLMARLEKYLGSRRNQNCGVTSIPAMPLGPLAVSSPLGFENSLVSEMKKSVHAVGALQIHIPSFPAISAARSAARDELLSPERNASVSTITGRYFYPGLIDKHGL